MIISNLIKTDPTYVNLYKLNLDTITEDKSNYTEDDQSKNDNKIVMCLKKDGKWQLIK